MKNAAARYLHTFSIAARCPKTGMLGVGVASKFLAVGTIVPWAQANVGAIATQSWANTSFGPNGLKLLREGRTAAETLETLLRADEGRESRQVGIVDAEGRSAAHTGSECHAYAGHRLGEGFCVQGNLLAGSLVLDQMVEAYQNSAELPFGTRLLLALRAGDNAGGDKRGKQGAALYVVKEKGSYDGHIDRYIDLRVDDHPAPVHELERLLTLHNLYFGESDLNRLKLIEGPLLNELVDHLTHFGYLSHGDYTSYNEIVRQALLEYVGVENFDARWREDNQIDEEILEFMRQQRSV